MAFNLTGAGTPQLDYSKLVEGGMINSALNSMVLSAQQQALNEPGDGDVLVRRVTNGYLVVLMGFRPHKMYVCTTADEIGDTVKLAMVNHEIDKAK
jgi:hypothetical protein